MTRKNIMSDTWYQDYLKKIEDSQNCLYAEHTHYSMIKKLEEQAKTRKLNEYEKEELKRAKINLYTYARKAWNRDIANFYLDKMQLRHWFNQKGFLVDECGNVSMSVGLERALVKHYMTDVLIKELEKIGLKGVKVRNKITARSRSMLDFSKVEVDTSTNNN